MFCLMVWVRLPDGSFVHLPVAYDGDDGMKVLMQKTKGEARDWAHFILPSLLKVKQVL